MRNKIPAYLTLLACALLAMNSYAGKDGQDRDDKERHGHHMKHFMPMHKMMKHLDLSEEQQQQFKSLHEKNKASYQEQHEALRKNHKQMHELIASGGYTEDKASQLAEQHGEIAAELARLRVAEMAKLYALLTPEQQKKFSSFHSENHHGKGEHKK